MSPTGRTPANDTSAAESFNQICTVRIELLDTDPLIWREVEVPTSITLKVLHDIVQITMGWLDTHLLEFTIDGRTYGLPMDKDWGTAPRIEAMKVRLRDVLKPRNTTIDYMYDFGDSWAHRLIVTGIRQGKPGVSYPHYLGGEWDCPPEDCGGIPGYYNMLDALADPEHPDHAEIAEYMEGWDPKEIDELPLKIALGRIANRRNAARTRIAKKERWSGAIRSTPVALTGWIRLGINSPLTTTAVRENSRSLSRRSLRSFQRTTFSQPAEGVVVIVDRPFRGIAQNRPV